MESTEASGVLTLPSNLNLIAAAPLKAQFLARRGETLYVDGANVARVGGQCLQVLLSARKTWAADGMEWVNKNFSPELISALEEMGVDLGESGLKEELAE
jgi:chemotaxis protein CheX